MSIVKIILIIYIQSWWKQTTKKWYLKYTATYAESHLLPVNTACETADIGMSYPILRTKMTETLKSSKMS